MHQLLNMYCTSDLMHLCYFTGPFFFCTHVLSSRAINLNAFILYATVSRAILIQIEIRIKLLRCFEMKKLYEKHNLDLRYL